MRHKQMRNGALKLLVKAAMTVMLMSTVACFHVMPSIREAAATRMQLTAAVSIREQGQSCFDTKRTRRLPVLGKSYSTFRMMSGSGEFLECSEDNVLRVLEMARQENPDMFGRSPRAQNIGITGDVALSSLDGPFVVLSLEGRFWHKRITVMTTVTNMLANYIPELAGVDVEDENMLLDIWEERDPATGEVVARVDRRAPDFNGDRETMEYNGVNPDDRGPFGQTLFG